MPALMLPDAIFFLQNKQSQTRETPRDFERNG
jgi:hypothetical protein